MANELKITINVNYEKSTEIVDLFESNNVTVTGTEYWHGIQSVGFSGEEAVNVADIGTQGYVYAKNLDSTNYVTIGTTGALAVKLKAGESNVWRTAGALYALANTAACRVEFLIFEE